jgi:hypothetical protein
MKTKTKNLLLGIAIGMGFSVATVAQNVPNYVPSNGLVGWWPFNGNANDESGNNNNGTVNGATLTADRFGNVNKAYSFDGNTSNILINSNTSLNLSSTFSFNFWIKSSQYPIGSSVSHLIVKGSNTTNEYSITWSNYKPALNKQGTQTIAITTNPLDTNRWYNLSFVFNYPQAKIYIDNILVVTGNATSMINSSNTPLYIGTISGQTGLNKVYKGVIDDIGIWNRELTQQEISDLYNGNICYQNITVTDTLIINTNLVGFNPVTYQNSIKIFPNPTNDHITINYGNYATLNNYQLRITNSLGQQMFQTTINQQSSYINLSNWTGNGIYFVHLIDPQGNTIDIRKIVLQ